MNMGSANVLCAAYLRLGGFYLLNNLIISPRSEARLVSPMNSVYCVLTLAQIGTCVTSGLKDHLTPGGGLSNLD